MLTKKCSTCKKDKLLDDFWNQADKKNGKSYQCKECRRNTKNKYYQNNIKKIQQSNLKYKYGMEPYEYNELLSKQNNVCAICKQSEKIKLKGVLKALCVDHDHKTGKIRGLLCDRCNKGIANFNDDIQSLQSAIEYLINVNL